MKKRFRTSYYIVSLILIVIFLVCLTDGLSKIYEKGRSDRRYKNYEFVLDDFRNFNISSDVILNYIKCEEEKREIYIKSLSSKMIGSNFDCSHLGKVDETYSKKIDKTKLENLSILYRIILDDIKYFPIPLQKEEKEQVSFGDSWGGERTYGGARKHEGTDIMTSNNIRGYFPVISMTDGVVEKKGWLKQGGYRIGIRSPKGGYYYYAHLYSYAPDLNEGDEVIAGQLLGFMGDSGYSDIEGTTGNFDVHLHVGIYFDYEKKETSINPYYILKALERRKLKFDY